MGNHADYVINYNPKIDTEETILKKIIYSLILRKLKFKFPAIMHISAKSGHGKSETALYFMDTILQMQNLNLMDYIEEVNIMQQTEYPDKVSKLLLDKELKKVNVLTVHEGRESMEANEWYSIFNRNVAHVNALARAVKRMATFIISQSIMDVTKQIRRTLDYQIKLRRPALYGVEGQVQFLWYILYIDDRNLEEPRLRKRKIGGYLIYPNGKWVSHQPKYFSIPKLPKEITKKFQEMDKDRKTKILLTKLEEMKGDLEAKKGKIEKVENLVNFYTKNNEAQQLYIKHNVKGSIKLDKEFAKIHSLNKKEIKEFKQKYKEALENDSKL